MHYTKKQPPPGPLLNDVRYALNSDVLWWSAVSESSTICLTGKTKTHGPQKLNFVDL